MRKGNVETLRKRLQNNIGIFNTMISNITKLNDEADTIIDQVQTEIISKQDEIKEIEEIKQQNNKIKTNLEALLK